MSEQEKSPEAHRQFLFKDKYGSYEVSQQLKELVDELQSTGVLNQYIEALAGVAHFQQAEYKGTESVLYTQSPRDTHDPVEASSVLEAASKRFEGERGMKLFIKMRDQILQTYGPETVAEIESFIGVDGRGVEAGDRRPLLGVDFEVLRALAHYVHREEGYEQIDEL